ncbi:hypothetical protein K438DRAFT_1955780 [Mycena galopus ATCC 62051]|nr:hypothetical protein K438DRAFT_1955780 [Mycena galopus ATCC 62051]
MPLWRIVPNTSASSPPARTQSTSAIHLVVPHSSHPTQPLLHLSTSEAVAYLDLLSHQPEHPSSRKGYLEEVVHKCLGRLQTVVLVWALYITIRYFVAFAACPSLSSVIALASLSLLPSATLLAAFVLPLIQSYILGHTHAHNPTLTTLWRIRTVLRYSLPCPGAMVLAWRTSSNTFESMAGGRRCGLDIDVVWSIHASLSPRNAPPAWGAWLGLSIARLLLMMALLAIAVQLARPAIDNVASAQPHRQSALPALPSASEADCELYSFVDRFQTLVSWISHEVEDSAQLTIPHAPSSSFASNGYSYVAYDEFRRPYPLDDHVQSLNAYVWCMPTIESIGSREISTSIAGGNVVGSSVYRGERRGSVHTVSGPPTWAMTDRSVHSDYTGGWERERAVESGGETEFGSSGAD